MAETTPIAAVELARLAELEAVVERGLQTLPAGRCLSEAEARSLTDEVKRDAERLWRKLVGRDPWRGRGSALASGGGMSDRLLTTRQVADYLGLRFRDSELEAWLDARTDRPTPLVAAEGGAR